MALKKYFNDEEKFGLTQYEIEIGEKYLRKHKTIGSVKSNEALKLYELYMVGCSFNEIKDQFPQYELGQIILTAAVQKWGMDRDRMHSSLRDRVKAKVIKSVMEQTDFLTSLLAVASSEHMKEMRDYILDPTSVKPSMRIKSIKEYKDVTETLAKIVQGATPSAKDNKHSPMFDALAPVSPRYIGNPNGQTEDKDDDIDIEDLLGKK
jgi:hypothetical protein